VGAFFCTQNPMSHMEFEIRDHNELVTEIAVNYNSDNPDLTVLLASDVHFDNPKCQRDIFFRHLDECQAAGGVALIIGDFFDVMAGLHDKRRSKSLLRPEYVGPDYLQRVLNDAVEKLTPYCRTIGMISLGNHETSIIKNVEINTDCCP